MGLRPVGTQFVTKGFANFSKQLGTINTQYQEINVTINKFHAANSVLSGSLGKVSVALAAVGGTVAVVKGGMSAIGKGFEFAKKAVSALIQPFKSFASVLANVGKALLNFAVGGVLDSVRTALSSIRSELGQTVADFQRLEIQYESLIARQLRVSDSTLSIADSMLMAQRGAQDLLGWVKQIAVTTPFEVSTISKTVAFSQAMGFTASQSKTLTEAIINFTSAMGLGQETMERIIQNFGQMRAAGKVTGTELRDLARGAMIPINDILNRMGQNLGVAEDKMDDFKKAAAEGRAPVDAFFQAFIDVANESFPNAAERMSRTFEGVKNNITDFFKTVVGVEALGPLFDRVTELMANALDHLLSPAVRRAARIIGESLLQGFDMVWDTVQTKLVPALRNLAQALGIGSVDGLTFARVIAKVSAVLSVAVEKISEFVNWLANQLRGQFDGITESARSWGFNMIKSLAEGMAQAAMFVINVLNQLGQVIASLLQPGSPPKLLPKLGEWGAAAMTEYMKGWLEADFSVFDKVAKKIESFIRSISGTILDQTDVVPKILEFRDALARAMNEIAKSGEVTQKTLKELFGALDGGTPELRKYVELQLELAKADAAVVKAQEKLNAITEKYDKQINKLKESLEDLTDAGDDLDDTRRITQLQLILQDVNASALDKERAAIEIAKLRAKQKLRGLEDEKEAAEEGARSELEAAKEKQKAIAAQLAAQEALIQMQIDTNELIKEQLELLESLKKKLKGPGGKGGEGDLFGLGGLLDPETSRKVSGQLKDSMDGISQIFEDMKESVTDSIDEILGSFANLEEGVNTLIGIWGGLGDLAKENRFSIALEEIRRSAEPVVESVQDLVSTFEDMVGIDFPSVSLNIGNVASSLADFVLNFTVGNINAYLSVFNGLVQAVAQPLQYFAQRIEALSTAWSDLLDSVNIDDFLENLRTLVTRFTELTLLLPYVQLIIEGFWEGVREVTVAKTGDIGTAVEGMKNDTVEKFSDMSTEIVGDEGSIMPKMLADMNTAVTNGTETMSGTFQTFKDDTIDKFEKMSEKLIGKSVVPEMLDAINDEFEKKLGIEGLIGIIDTELTNAYDAFDEKLWGIYDDVIKPFVGAAIAILQTIANKLALIISKAGTAEDALKSVDKGGGVKKKGVSGDLDSGEMARTVVVNPVIGAVGGGSSYNTEYNLNMTTSSPSRGVERAFRIMELMNT